MDAHRVILAAGAALALVAGGTAAGASIGSGPSGHTAVGRNTQGTSGVISMTQYRPNNAPLVTGGTWRFLGAPPVENFTGTSTAAEVTGTVGEASNGTGGNGSLGICYQPASGGSLTEVSDIPYTLSSAASNNWSIGQTVSGVVGNLAAGRYIVGLCARGQNNAGNGEASVTIILADTGSGAS